MAVLFFSGRSTVYNYNILLPTQAYNQRLPIQGTSVVGGGKGAGTYRAVLPFSPCRFHRRAYIYLYTHGRPFPIPALLPLHCFLLARTALEGPPSCIVDMRRALARTAGQECYCSHEERNAHVPLYRCSSSCSINYKKKIRVSIYNDRRQGRK